MNSDEFILFSGGLATIFIKSKISFILYLDNVLPTVSRIILFEMKPIEGQYYPQKFESESSLRDFINEGINFFREYYLNGNIVFGSGDYVGLCGKRFLMETSYNEVILFYDRNKDIE